MTETPPTDLSREGPRMSTIVLATDGSPDARRARLASASLATLCDASVHLVEAWRESVGAYSGFAVVAPVSEELRADAAATVAAEAEALRAASVRRIEEHVGEGHSAAVVLDLAEEVDADLIAVGSRGNGGLRRLLLGSVAEAIVHRSRRPVLVTRGEAAWPPTHVVAAFDGSPEACHAAHVGALIARAAGCGMSLLQVVPHDAEERVPLRDMSFGDALEGVIGQLERHTRRLSEIAGATVATSVAVGDPAHEIISAVEAHGGAGMVALGSHGFGRAHRLILGSVSTKVLHALHGSVLIVPPRARSATHH